MLEVPVYNISGQKIDTLKVDEQVLGGTVNAALVKQAVVAYHANQRQGTAQTKSRADVAGSTRKLYRQKGTGNARRGNVRTNVMKGGGMAFAKRTRDFRQALPKKMRQAALKSAILAKLLGSDLMVLDGLNLDAPKTAQMAKVLQALQINRSCLLTLAQRDANVYLSSRNLPDLTVRIAEELNAYDVATRQKMIVTLDAMKALVGQESAQ
ncbi:MAG: 50S ribosomal protein L4 [Planctomycetes bacterium ADurb.Bin126]|nr:MAG: 50S ribosomal protein L4 [Planctomycetes bacterium ADurb.Bin126]HOD79835.1 50S ribosomal protein L4 [Phycisphaerae bacterium]HQL72843.1 50S ribosomal protein L4 [Phycisphaerae bacterium]